MRFSAAFVAAVANLAYVVHTAPIPPPISPKALRGVKLETSMNYDWLPELSNPKHGDFGLSTTLKHDLATPQVLSTNSAKQWYSLDDDKPLVPSFMSQPIPEPPGFPFASLTGEEVSWQDSQKMAREDTSSRSSPAATVAQARVQTEHRLRATEAQLPDTFIPYTSETTSKRAKVEPRRSARKRKVPIKLQGGVDLDLVKLVDSPRKARKTDTNAAGPSS